MQRDSNYWQEWGEVKDEYGRDIILPGGSDSGSVLLHGFSTGMKESYPAEDTGPPRHIYVTEEDVSTIRKVVAKVRCGRVVPFRFHLRCECTGQEHAVDGQGGRTFYVVDEDFAVEEGLRSGIAKTAAAVLKSVNNVVPGASALASLPLYDGTPVYCDTIEDMSSGTSQFRKPGATLSDQELREQVEKDMQNSRAGPWMNTFLSFGPGIKEIREFRKDFLLREVEYLASSSSCTRAWMCQQHYREGVDQGILKKIM